MSTPAAEATRTRRLPNIVVAVAVLGVVAGGAWYFLRSPAPDAGRDVPLTAVPAPLVPTGPSLPSEDFAPLVAQRLAAMAMQEQLSAVATGNVVKFNAGAVTLDTRLEHDEATEDHKRGVGIAIGATFPDEPFHFISGAIGVGATRSQAVDQAVAGWLGVSGTAILDAVARRTAPRNAFAFGPLTAFPGYIAARGPVELHWTPKRDEELLAAVTPALLGLAPNSSHSVALSIMVIGEVALDGQCLVDNATSEEVCKLAKKFPWPSSSEGYLARQVFVLRPRVGVAGGR